MNKKIYLAPVIEVEALECATVIAASFGIGSGGTDGQGGHGISGAKETCYIYEEDFEEEYFEEDPDSYAPFPTW